MRSRIDPQVPGSEMIGRVLEAIDAAVGHEAANAMLTYGLNTAPSTPLSVAMAALRETERRYGLLAVTGPEGWTFRLA